LLIKCSLCRAAVGLLDSHGFLQESSESDDAGLKGRPFLWLGMPASLHEVQVGRQAGEGATRQVRLWWDGWPPLLLSNGHHDLHMHR